MNISIILGLVLIVCGLCVRIFKMYGFINRYDVLNEDTKEYIDIDKISRAIALFLYSLGIFTIILRFYDSFVLLIVYVIYIFLGGLYLSRFYDKKCKKIKKSKEPKVP